MGRKRALKVEHLFLYVTSGVIILIGLFGCAHSRPPDTPRQQADAFLSGAAQDAARGDFEPALEKNDIALQRYFELVGDRALYQRGLFYLHSKNPKKNSEKSIGYFNKLKERFPQSERSAEAETWLITLKALEEKNNAIKTLKTGLQENQDALTRLTHKNNALKARTNKLKAKIRALENQIEKLKNVDLGIEQKKRETVEH